MTSNLDQPLHADTVDRLMTAHQEYERTVSAHYDDVLPDISHRIQEAGSVGKADIGALVLWKRISASTKWASALMALPDQHVRDITSQAVRHVHDNSLTVADAATAARLDLVAMPGFTTGDALASAVLFVAAPDRMAVYDRRAQTALNRLGLTLSPKPGRYGRYMHLVEQLTRAVNHTGHEWRARDVDVALYWLGR